MKYIWDVLVMGGGKTGPGIAPGSASNQYKTLLPLYTAGLKFYDLLAGHLSIGKLYFINKKNWPGYQSWWQKNWDMI